MRDGLRGILEGSPDFEVVGEAANGAEAVTRARALRPDVVLMDLRMPDVDGVTAIKRLAELGSDARVLVLTTYDTDADVVPAIEAGATGYLLKDAPRGDLLRGRAGRRARRGRAVPVGGDPAARPGTRAGTRQDAGPESLSARELDVLALIARGCSNRDAAVRLFISEATVKTHLLHIYAKLGVNDRAAAVAAGFERGLLPRAVDRVSALTQDRRGFAASLRKSARRFTGAGCARRPRHRVPARAGSPRPPGRARA